MRLLPREEDRLLLFLAAELAAPPRPGLKLGQAEAVALIGDELCEAARDGLPYGAVEARGYAALGPADVLDGVPELVTRVEVEALLADGSRLFVLHHPIARDRPRGRPSPRWSGSARPRRWPSSTRATPVGVTSHFHFFEVNRAVRFDRAAAWACGWPCGPA